MNIGIDARCIQVNKKAGINVYTNEIIKNLDSNLSLFLSNALPDDSLQSKKNISKISLKLPTYRWRFEQIWETLLLPRLVNKTNIDVFWGPRFFAPPRLKKPSVVTIHDIAFMLIDGLVDKHQLDYFMRLLHLSIKNADLFIAVSETTKNDFCTHFNIPDEKVKVVYNGYDPYYAQPFEEQFLVEVKNKFAIKDDFILFLGTLEPRKNLERLVKAYLNSEAFSQEAQLVLAGKTGWFNNDLMKLIQPHIDSKKIILTGFVSNAELKALYQSCLFFAFPSLYEGFGIPAIEAMASHSAVLTSNNSSLGELFKDVAITVDPYSIDSISEGINSLLDDEKRKITAQKGHEFSKSFSWGKCANEHLEVFKSLL